MSINMSCSDGSYDLSSEYGAELCSQSLDSRELSDSDHDLLPDSASAVSESDQDLLPDSASTGSASVLKLLADDVPYTNHPRLQSDRNAGSA